MRYRCPVSASERAYAYAKERILDGRFGGGELISEGDVARPLELSRTPVREAFLQLEAEGLLRLYPRRGAVVVPVSAAEVAHVMETRAVVETFAIRKSIEAGVDLSTDLARALDLQRQIVSKEDRLAFVDADREFHRVFMVTAGNPILLELLDSLRDRQSRMGIAAIAMDSNRMNTILREHQELADAVIGHDLEAATDLLGRHLEGTLHTLTGGRIVGA